MQIIAPYRICRLIGHRREGYSAGQYLDRRGRWRTRWHQRCTRCGASDGGEVFNEGRFERWRIWRMRAALYRARLTFADWRRSECEDCHRPTIRFGRRVGNHDNCDVIPF